MTEPWVEGWSMPRGATRYHYYVSEQVKLCPDNHPWNEKGKDVVVHPRRIIPPEEAVPDPWECNVCAGIVDKLGYRTDPDPEPIANGFTLTPSRGQTRIELECRHQHGLIYVTEGAEANFVCSSRRRPAHSLAGFFRELGELQDTRVKGLMQRWGLYYRSLPLEVDDNDDAEANQPVSIPVGAAAGHQGAGDGPEGEHSP